MPSEDAYREKAAELCALALNETNSTKRAGLTALVLSYLRLAEQAARNAQTDVVYEPRPPAPMVQQQQQQVQPQDPMKDGGSA